MSSSVLAIKTFEETRQVWSAIPDHAAAVTSIIKRLIAGELTSDDLATPESATDMGGQGFDKVRNPNWFRGLYGRALSRVCVSARIPADLYDSLQHVTNWQDTLRKALQRLANDAHALLQERKQAEVEAAEVVVAKRKRTYYQESDAFNSFFYKRGEEYHKLWLELVRLKAGEKSVEFLMSVDDIFEELDDKSHDAGDEELRKMIKFYADLIKTKKNSKIPGSFATINHILRGLRLVRTEMNAMAAA